MGDRGRDLVSWRNWGQRHHQTQYGPQRTNYQHNRDNQYGSSGTSRPSSVEEPSVAPMVTLHAHGRPYEVQLQLPVDGKGTQIDMDCHEALVKILSLDYMNIHVQRAKPMDGESIPWPRWIKWVLPSKRFHAWLDTRRWLGFLKDEVDKLKDLEDIADVFDLLVQCEVRTVLKSHSPRTGM